MLISVSFDSHSQTCRTMHTSTYKISMYFESEPTFIIYHSYVVSGMYVGVVLSCIEVKLSTQIKVVRYYFFTSRLLPVPSVRNRILLGCTTENIWYLHTHRYVRVLLWYLHTHGYVRVLAPTYYLHRYCIYSTTYLWHYVVPIGNNTYCTSLTVILPLNHNYLLF